MEEVTFWFVTLLVIWGNVLGLLVINKFLNACASVYETIQERYETADRVFAFIVITMLLALVLTIVRYA